MKKHRSALCGLLASTTLFAGLAAPAMAQGTTADQNQTVDDIVVTATRRSESLQKVPIAITALNDESLTQSNIADIKSVQLLAPGIQVQPQFVPGNVVFQIRGQYQADTGPTIDPSVGVYFDDIYIAQSSGSLTNFVDLERVEVLKGPQGTLFGKNTTGGAIRLVSKRPTHEFEGYGDVSYEQFDRLKLEGVVNVPISEAAAVRMVGQYVRKSDGYGVNETTGRPVDTERTYFGRISLLLEPADRLELLVQGDYSHSEVGGLPTFLKHYTAQNDTGSALEVAISQGLYDFTATGLAAAFAAGAGILQGVVTGAHGGRHTFLDNSAATSQGYAFVPGAGFVFNKRGTIDPGGNSEVWGVSANIRYELGDDVNIRSITAYRHTDYEERFDIDGTRYFLIDNRSTTRSSQFSEEMLLSGSAVADRLNWTVGGLYFQDKPHVAGFQAALAGVQALFSGKALLEPVSAARNESFGVFAQATFDVTDAFSITGGVRYSHDKRDFEAQSFDLLTSGARVCGYTAANGLANLPNFSLPCNITQSASFKKINYTASFSYDIGRSGVAYARTSRSYRAGGFAFRLTAPEVLGSFKPEVVTDYEIGIKADWLDRHLRTNIAVFHSIGTDVQTTINGVSPTTGAVITPVINSGKRKVDGFEAEIVARPSSWYSVDASLTYLHARVTNPFAPDETFIAATPPWSWTVGSNLDLPFSDAFSGHLRVDLSYRDKMHDGPPLRDTAGVIIYTGYLRSAALLGARFTLHHEATGADLSIYGRNLTNLAYESRQTPIAGLGMTIANVAEPRVVGLEVKFPFGKRR